MHYLIIGGCAAGLNCIEGIRKIDTKGEITLISNESYPPYARCLITEYLIGTRSEKDLFLREDIYYERMGINLLLGKEVIKIETRNKKVILSDGKEIRYDKLLIATGSSPKKLDCKGEEKEGIFGFRNIEDVCNIRKRSEKSEKVIVFGGGLIGIKAGYALKKRGLGVEIIVKSPQVLSRVVNPEAAEIISEHLQQNGIKIRKGLAPVEIIGNKEMKGAVLDNGEVVESLMGIVGKGVAPNLSPFKNSGLEIHWGIKVNERMETNIKDIYAAGDVAETKDIIDGTYTINATWLNAQEQGYVAGINMAGGEKVYQGSIAANSAEFFGLPFISIGQVKETENSEIIEIKDRLGYKRFILKNNRVVGAVFIEDVKHAGFYMSLIRSRIDLSEYKKFLGKDWFDIGYVRELLENKEGFRESISPEGERIFFK